MASGFGTPLVDHRAIVIDAQALLGNGRARHVASYTTLELGAFVRLIAHGAIDGEAIARGGERFGQYALIGHRAGVA